MKVLNWLEFSNPGATYERKNMLKYFGKITAHEYYSQPFKAELIIELFKGWKTNAKSECEYEFATFCNSSAEIDFGEYHDDNIYSINNGDYILFLRTPETLNDFIRDCQRVEIKLEWRMK